MVLGVLCTGFNYEAWIIMIAEIHCKKNLFTDSLVYYTRAF